MRLRPSGAAGLLVSSLAAFREYQVKQAWTWERQALVRARPVAGSPELGRHFEELRREVLAWPRDIVRLRREVREMRDKMRAHLLGAETSGGKSPRFHIKQSVGGIVDIEFMVQYCVLAWSRDYPALSVYTDNIRILEALSESGLIPPAMRSCSPKPTRPIGRRCITSPCSSRKILWARTNSRRCATGFAVFGRICSAWTTLLRRA